MWLFAGPPIRARASKMRPFWLTNLLWALYRPRQPGAAESEIGMLRSSHRLETPTLFGTRPMIRWVTTASLVGIAFLSSLLVAPRASRAATVIAGGNSINQTWTPAGSPYIVPGDVVVPAGAYLVVQAGTIVTFASTDGQAAGLDPLRVELTVHGVLAVEGTDAS